MPRPIEALIHPGALAHNLARARQAAPDARVWAVVKANAYGHGIERAFDGLRSADGFALLDLAEAERVRSLGWRGPILLLEGCSSRATWSCVRAWACGMPCTRRPRSTGWPRTRRSCRTVCS
jgi:alanine racemase